jgi:hypothetical protein
MNKHTKIKIDENYSLSFFCIEQLNKIILYFSKIFYSFIVKYLHPRVVQRLLKATLTTVIVYLWNYFNFFDKRENCRHLKFDYQFIFC